MLGTVTSTPFSSGIVRGPSIPLRQLPVQPQSLVQKDRSTSTRTRTKIKASEVQKRGRPSVKIRGWQSKVSTTHAGDGAEYAPRVLPTSTSTIVRGARARKRSFARVYFLVCSVHRFAGLQSRPTSNICSDDAQGLCISQS